MGHHRGPKTTTQDLIFYYDTGNEKSFAGEPTTNVLTNTNLDDGWAKGYHYDIIINDPYPKPAGITSQSVSFKSANSYGYWYSYGDYAPQEDNTTYSVSVWARTVGGNFYITPYTADNGESHRFWMSGKEVIGNGQWQRLTWDSAFTTPINNDSDSLSFNFGSMPIGQRCWLLAPQLEPKSKVTPFVVGTRSNTQGLIDLSRNTTINLTNSSFDSNGQLTFDGTDDFIDTNFPAQTIPNVTIEAIFYDTKGSGYRSIVQNNLASDDALYINPSNQLMFWPCTSSSFTISTNTWYYVAVTYNGSKLTYFVNGTFQDITTTCADITDWDFLRIGAHGASDGERFAGKIPLVRVYKRMLTNNEILQNYNALKNRFGL